MEEALVVKNALNATSLILFIVLIALGLAIVFGMMNVINMAHGDFLMIGAYAVYACQSAGAGYWLGLALAPIVAGTVAIGVERSCLRFLYARRDMSTLLATWGIGILIQQAVRFGFGPGPREVAPPFDTATSVFGAAYPTFRLFVMLVALAVILASLWVFWRTRFGTLVRAAIQNGEMASLLGIDTQRFYLATFVFGCALAGLAGALIAPLASVTPTMGIDYIARSFFAVIVGGMGGVMGAVFGGTIIGGAESVFALNLSPTTAEILVFVVVIVVVVLRPRGLTSR